MSSSSTSGKPTAPVVETSATGAKSVKFRGQSFVVGQRGVGNELGDAADAKKGFVRIRFLSRRSQAFPPLTVSVS